MSEPKYEITKGEIYSGTYSELLRYFKEVIKVKPLFDRDSIETAGQEGCYEISQTLTIESQLDKIKSEEKCIGKVFYLKSETDHTRDHPTIILRIESPFVFIRNNENKGIPDERA